jgi:DNA repair exonuclease SbcCD nuclease subunit
MQLLGDTHLGRAFKTGVPLHRIGDRERMVWNQFETSLQATGLWHIHMGDLFDKFVVPPEVVLMAAEMYREAAARHPHATFVVLMGNHDPSKDSTKRSSFDIFEALVADINNLLVIRKPTLIGSMGFIPYSVFGSAEESLAELLERGTPEVIFGHFDVVDFGGSNVVPTAALAAAGIHTVYTGHDHLARVEKRHGVTINVVGSMQPYSHAEDAEGVLYHTVPLADVEGHDWSNINLRVVLADGESLPTGIDCLSLTAKRVSSAPEETVDTEEFDGIDLTAELEAILPPEIRVEVMEIFKS